MLDALPERIAVFACSPACAPIPWQLDERDPEGRYVLEHGRLATRDIDEGRVDANDELLVMWSDTGDSVTGRIDGNPICTDTVSIELGAERRSIRIARFDGPAPRSKQRYVDYDPVAKTMSGRLVDLEYAHATPRGLRLRAGSAPGRDLLDRLKIRASARFFGIFPLYRDEDDIRWVEDAWRVGAIRVIRRERKWVRLGFGFRTPYMLSETTFYRDFAQLPVSMRLNFAPSTLLSAIEIDAALDFIDLEGWRLSVPDEASEIVVGRGMRVAPVEGELAEPAAVALEGPDATLAMVLRLGEGLQSLRKTVLYDETRAGRGPEDVAGAMPAVGFRLSRWGEVRAGAHGFVAEAYALPAGYGVARLSDEIAAEPRIEVVEP